jgi:chromosome segregation ATPase
MREDKEHKASMDMVFRLTAEKKKLAEELDIVQTKLDAHADTQEKERADNEDLRLQVGRVKAELKKVQDELKGACAKEHQTHADYEKERNESSEAKIRYDVELRRVAEARLEITRLQGVVEAKDQQNLDRMASLPSDSHEVEMGRVRVEYEQKLMDKETEITALKEQHGLEVIKTDTSLSRSRLELGDARSRIMGLERDLSDFQSQLTEAQGKAEEAIKNQDTIVVERLVALNANELVLRKAADVCFKKNKNFESLIIQKDSQIVSLKIKLNQCETEREHYHGKATFLLKQAENQCADARNALSRCYDLEAKNKALEKTVWTKDFPMTTAYSMQLIKHNKSIVAEGEEKAEKFRASITSLVTLCQRNGVLAVDIARVTAGLDMDGGEWLLVTVGLNFCLIWDQCRER